MPCRTRKCVPTAISGGVDISETAGCHLLRQTISHWWSQKLLQGLVSHDLTAYLSVSDVFFTQWIMTILSNGCKQDNFESRNSLKLLQIFVAFVRILLNVNLSLNQTLLTFLLYGDKLEWLNWFSQFLCERLSSFNQNGFYYSYTWPCSLYEARTSFCTRLISRKFCGFLLMFLTSFTSLSVLLVFLLSITLCVFMHGFWFWWNW